jgi:hypothetical protein
MLPIAIPAAVILPTFFRNSRLSHSLAETSVSCVTGFTRATSMLPFFALEGLVETFLESPGYSITHPPWLAC